MGNALRKNVAVFHQVPAKGVDALGALPHQEIAGAEHDAVRLLLFGSDRNQAHARPLGRFTDGLCIGRIVLPPLDERLDVGRRDQAHIMTQLSDLTRPVVRPGTGFHRDDAPGLRCEEIEKLRASDALAKEHMPGAIRSMYLEHVLRDVQPDRANLLHGSAMRCQPILELDPYCLTRGRYPSLPCRCGDAALNQWHLLLDHAIRTPSGAPLRSLPLGQPCRRVSGEYDVNRL